MEQIAFGWLGLSYDEFYDSTFSEFWNRLKGWQEQEDRRRDIIRTQTWYLVTMLVGKYDTPEDLWPTKPIEEKTGELSQDQRALLEKLDKIPIGTATDIVRNVNDLKRHVKQNR